MDSDCKRNCGGRKMHIDELGINLPSFPGLEVTGVTAESKTVSGGNLFVALAGANVHGASFIAQAVEKGAAAVLTDAAGFEIILANDRRIGIPVIVDETPRSALAKAASRWFGDVPETIVAVTGTNGKTSVASMSRQIWQELGRAAVNCGTTGVEGAFSATLKHTTPDPITLHRLLSRMKRQEITHVAIEASSHGIKQKRLDGLTLAAAAFTNLTHDHLDYHSDLESYFAAKAELFERLLPKSGFAVVCIDSERGLDIANTAQRRGQQLLTIGFAAADLQILSERITRLGQEITFSWQGQKHEVHLNLIGGFQAVNALAAAGLTIASGEDPAAVFSTLPCIQNVRGRMQLAAVRENGAPIFVDYAHTPEALRSTLLSLRRHLPGRLIVVFGAGGDRDRQKRPLMGRISAEHADIAFVTDDNPRGEAPAAIRSEIMEGCPDCVEIDDRAKAILLAVDALEPGDGLVIAGKGHERGQIIGDSIYPFDDAEQASIAVRAMDGKAA